ncbi:MAG: hypothetical protein Q9161_006550 [Pseudevernia consocians]
MNTIREIQNLNKRELENGVYVRSPLHPSSDSLICTLTTSSLPALQKRLGMPITGTTEATPRLLNQQLTLSRDTAYVYIGGLPFDLSEGDILTIFSQFGEPTYINLIRDKESGKSKGFAFLKYEDQRSTDLAVDNLGGASVMGRVLKVDHTRYKRKDGEEEEERERGLHGGPAVQESEEESEEERRPMVKEEVELQELLRDHDDDDPMKDYLVQEKREGVARALARLKDGGKKKKERKHKHQHHHHSHRHEHRERGRSDADGEKDSRRRPGHGDGPRHSHRRRSRSP